MTTRRIATDAQNPLGKSVICIPIALVTLAVIICGYANGECEPEEAVDVRPVADEAGRVDGTPEGERAAAESEDSAGDGGTAAVYEEWPFGAEEAKRRQRETAEALGIPGEKTLDLGDGVTMKLVLIPAGEFMMGSGASPAEVARKGGGKTKWYEDEHPQRRVTLTRPFYMGVCEVTQEQYEQVMGENPSRFEGERKPVEKVSWEDAVAFCWQLSARMDLTVQLPTEAQWEYACRAGTTTPFHTGETISTDQANYDGDSVYGDGRKGEDRAETIPVGRFDANAFGLHDMHGNVWEWCADWWQDSYEGLAREDPKGPLSGRFRVLRGGSWNYYPRYCRSAGRIRIGPDYRGSFIGFRVVVLGGDPRGKEATGGTAAVYEEWPFDATEAKRRQRETAEALGIPVEKTLDLGDGVTMKLVLLPAGEFMMGSGASPAEVARKGGGEAEWYEDEHPQRRVTLTEPFYMGVCEVTQAQYEQVMGENPSHFKGARNPVESVSWEDAEAFCRKLSARMDLTVQLPTEAQWEYACRAGTETPFHTGETISTDQANYDGDSVYGDGRKGEDRDKPIPVGRFDPNAFGLHDMHGNVYEWCANWYQDSYEGLATEDPKGPRTGERRVLRGGSWILNPRRCRSALRDRGSPDLRGYFVGFRVVVLGGGVDLP